MKLIHSRRRGVASVIGTIFFVLVLVAAIGAQAYMSSLQAQSAQAVQRAQSVAAQKADELLVYSSPPSGLASVNSGPTTVKVVAMILEFENGSVYSLNSGSSPAFSPVTLSQSSNTPIQPLVPSGVCKDQSGVGTATCLSKYNSIVSSVVAGRSVGLVTILGNTFWYVPSTSTAGISTSMVTSTIKTTGWVSTTLTAPISPNTNYAFTAQFFAAATSAGSAYMEAEVYGLPSGASVIELCSSGPGNGNNACTTTTVQTATYLSTSTGNQWWAVVGAISVGSTGGTLQLDFASAVTGYPVKLLAGSFMTVQPVP